MKLSELESNLYKLKTEKSDLEDNYQNKKNDLDNKIEKAKNNINAFLTVGSADSYNQLKSATSHMYLYNGTPKGILNLVSTKYYSINFVSYLMKLKYYLAKTINGEKCNSDSIGEQNLLNSNLEIQDNSYGGDPTQYAELVRNGYGSNYHPCLNGIFISSDTSMEELEQILLVIDKILKEPNIEYHVEESGWDKYITVKLSKYVKAFFQLLLPSVDLDEKEFTVDNDNKVKCTFITLEAENEL